MYGHDPEPIFSQQGITKDMMVKPGARALQTIGDNLWYRASQTIDDPCFGLKSGNIWHPSHLNALGYAWLASATLREALTRLKRYIHAITRIAILQLVDVDDGLALYLKFKPTTIMIPSRTDSFFSIVTSMCRVNYGATLNPQSVSFVHAAPSCAGEYFAYFKSPVAFRADRNLLVFPKERVDAPLKGYNPEIARIHDQIIIRYLAGLKKEDIAQRVKSAIIKKLPSGGVSDEIVAKELHMSVRSLQRSLRSEGTTFGKLLDEVRKDLATDYVRDQGINLTEVAFILGFSELSAFSRAFKKWTGRSPSEVRQAA
jgi:AraC-like DNA-binding protein